MNMDLSNDVLLKKLGARLRERDFDERMADAIATRILADEPKAEAKKPGRILRFGRMYSVAAPLAMAAAIALFVGTRSSNEQASEAPSYELAIIGAKTHRALPIANAESSTKTEITLDPNGDFDLVARPKTPARNVVVRAQLFREGKELPWSAPIDVSPDGAVRITSTTRALFPETRGAYDVVLLVGSQKLSARVRFLAPRE